MKEFDKYLIGKRIKQLREAKNFSQDYLGEKINMDASSLSKLENGRNAPSLPTLIKIISALNVEPNEIFEYEHLSDEKTLDGFNITIYNSLSLSKKQTLYKILRALEDYK